MNKVCITTIVSGRYADYIPMFHYMARKTYPLCDIKIFIRKNEYLYLNDGDYILNPPCLDQYPLDDTITASLRFVECESFLKDYDYVLFTDIDMLLTDTDMLQKRLDGMIKDNTECYETYMQDDNRLNACLFVTKDWWAKTRLARIKQSERLKDGNIDYNNDEQMLYEIVRDSGLNMPSKKTKFWNHHGIHLGEYRKGLKLPVRRKYRSANLIAPLMKGKEFRELADACSCTSNTIKKIIEYFKRR